MKKLLVVLLCIAFLTSCSSSFEVQNNESNQGQQEEPLTESIELDLSEESIEGVDREIPKVFLDYMNEKDPDGEILFYEKSDIDVDGEEEIVIASGQNYDGGAFFTEINQAYVLKQENEKIIEVSHNLAQDCYGVNEVKLITLQELPGQFIFCGLTNGVRLGGFHIYQLVESEIQSFDSSYSATGVGEDSLQDFDNDGQIDGYVSIRSSYDFLYYTLISYYMLEEEAFVLKKSVIEDMPSYPDNAEDVVHQYLELKVLDNGECEDIKDRLKELVHSADVNDIEIKHENWYNPLMNTLLEINEQIKFTVIEEETEKCVEVTYTEADTEMIGFKVYLVQDDGKWRINRITDI